MPAHALELHAIATYSALRLVDSLAEGLIVFLCVALLLRFLRRQSAGTRFALGFSALLTIAVLPFTSSLWTHSGIPPKAINGTTFVVPESWAVYLFGLWAVIAALLLAQIAKGVWHLYQLRKSCIRIDPVTLDPVVQQTLCTKRTGRDVSLCTSDRVQVPTAIGLISPAIVIPRWVLQDLSSVELNQIVLHELAHLRRWDDWTNLAQQVVRALFFFHPAVWWIEKKVALEREMACDDAVLAEVPSPRAYAECLTHLAERTFLRRSIALAQGAVGRITQISQRVAQILDPGRPKGDVRSWKLAVSVMAGVGVLCSAWAAKTPELITFGDKEPDRVELANSIPNPVTLPATKAALLQRVAPASITPLRIAPKLNRRSPALALGTQGRRLAARTESAATDLVHLSGLRYTSVPTTETVFVVVESGHDESSGQSVYQIQMWHLTILPAPADSGNKTPSKKT
jgi:beta-lactamase regulating signal transducer with metallopeptidase domain